MVDRQQEVVFQFKKAYPDSTLKQACELTGINVTRIHRILQGAPMRLWEWESFTQAVLLKNESPIDYKLREAFEQCVSHLRLRAKVKLLVHLERLNLLTRLVGEPTEEKKE